MEKKKKNLNKTLKSVWELGMIKSPVYTLCEMEPLMLGIMCWKRWDEVKWGVASLRKYALPMSSVCLFPQNIVLFGEIKFSSISQTPQTRLKTKTSPKTFIRNERNIFIFFYFSAFAMVRYRTIYCNQVKNGDITVLV